LALATQPRRTVPPSPARPPPHSSLTIGPQGHDRRPQWKSRANRPITHAQKTRPPQKDQLHWPAIRAVHSGSAGTDGTITHSG
jgi:hypothetical protein